MSGFPGTQWRGGRGHKRYHYTIPEIAAAKKVTLHAVRKAIARGVLDPGNLESLMKYMLSGKCREIVGTYHQKGPKMNNSCP